MKNPMKSLFNQIINGAYRGNGAAVQDAARKIIMNKTLDRIEDSKRSVAQTLFKPGSSKE